MNRITQHYWNRYIREQEIKNEVIRQVKSDPVTTTLVTVIGFLLFIMVIAQVVIAVRG